MAISFVDAPIQPRCSALQEDFIFLKEATHKEKGRLKQKKTTQSKQVLSPPEQHDHH